MRISSRYFLRNVGFGLIILIAAACVPPDTDEEFPDDDEWYVEKDEERCGQLLSSAAEYYKNKDWKSFLKIELNSGDTYEKILDMILDNPLYFKSQTINRNTLFPIK